MRIAMWSGPRNLSTALMYAFGARGDCTIVDEPFYAAFLRQTGAGHPMAADVIAAHETDPVRVAEMCLAAPPAGKSFTYMKHMPHHMVPGFPLAWAETCENAHLIRHPARVIASYAAKQTEITAADIDASAYIVDDETVAKTDGGGTRSIAGTIKQVDAAGVWILFA